jgi:tRNA A-37 threonylcarbamoyl transferase component Bud32
MSPTLRDQLQSALGGAYALDRELVGGGMAYVFLADDRALGRRVVVKVLRPELAEGLSAARFKREIQLAARLQHPHIVPLLAAGELASQVLYYSMPYVEGESLRGRLDRVGSLPVAEAVAILRDVASALAYAHRQRVVHRDIKPENILLADGGAVVADFGIAKAISASIESDAEQAGDGRRASTLTLAGISLGTPAYMAPEQGAGDAVDHRADLYSLGVVAYELLAGSLPFEGRNTQQLLAAHAAQAPEPLVRRRAAVPEPLAALVMQLLEKQPADRPQTADDVLRQLDEATADGPARRVPGRTSAVPSRARLRDPLVLALALALAISLGTLAWVARSPGAREGAPRPVIVSLNPPDGASLRIGNGFSLSADGRRLAFVADLHGAVGIWVRALDARTATFVPGTEGGYGPFWSPDGASLGFFAGGKLKVVELPGGTPRILCPAPRSGGGTWTADGTIVFTPNVVGVPLYHVAASGGPCTELTRFRPGDVDHRRPFALPDGRHVLFSSSGAKTALAVDVATGAITEVRHPGGDAQFAPPNWLLYRDEDRGIIYAQRLDLRTLHPFGDSYVVLDSAPFGLLSFPGYAVRERVLMVPHGFGNFRTLLWLDRRSVVIDSIVLPAGAGTIFGSVSASLSHDGRSIALGGTGLFLYDRGRGVSTQAMLGESVIVGDPSWSPGDSLIAFSSVLGAPGALRLYHVGSGTTDSLFAARRRQAMMADWSPDGRRIAFQLQAGDDATVSELWVWSRDTRTAHRMWPAAGNQAWPRWSPDGRWLAYQSDESGQNEVYVRPADGSGAGIRVSSAGGERPRWQSDGRALFYRAPDGAVMTAGLRPGAALALSPPRLAVSGAPFSRTIRGFEVSADGERFLGFARTDPTVFTVMLDWAARLPPR